MVNITRLNQIKEMGCTYDVNCWGSTLYTLGVLETPEWVHGAVMHEWLIQNTEVITKLGRNGDIIATYDVGGLFDDDVTHDKSLEHTGVFLGNRNGHGKVCFHKCGSGPAHYDNKTGVINAYDHRWVEYRRLKVSIKQARESYKQLKKEMKRNIAA